MVFNVHDAPLLCRMYTCSLVCIMPFIMCIFPLNALLCSVLHTGQIGEILFPTHKVCIFSICSLADLYNCTIIAFDFHNYNDLHNHIYHQLYCQVIVAILMFIFTWCHFRNYLISITDLFYLHTMFLHICRKGNSHPSFAHSSFLNGRDWNPISCAVSVILNVMLIVFSYGLSLLLFIVLDGNAKLIIRPLLEYFVNPFAM